MRAATGRAAPGSGKDAPPGYVVLAAVQIATTSPAVPTDLDALDAALGELQAAVWPGPRGTRFRGGHRTRRTGHHRRPAIR